MHKTFVFLTMMGYLTIESAYSQPLLIDELKTKLETHRFDDTVKVNILNELSARYQWENFYNSLEYAEQALRTAQQLSFQNGMATALYRSAHCYWALGDAEIAIERALKAYEIGRLHNLPKILGESSQILARCYLDQTESQKAAEYINYAEQIALSTNDWDLLSRVYNLAGVIQFFKQNDDSSLLLYNKALDVTKIHTTGKAQLSQIISNIGEYHMRTNPDRGLVYYNTALVSARENKNRSAEAGIMSVLGIAYTEKGMHQEAEKYLEASLNLSRKLGLRRIVSHTYSALVYLKTKEGNTEEALQYMKNYYDVRDSLVNISKTREIVQLEAQYENDKKEQQIKLLEQEKRIQTIWKNVLIVGAIFMAIALGIIYRLQKLKASKAKLLLRTQKELNNKLKETDTLKSRFFANISHEFRTPLSLILAPIEEKLAKPELKASELKNLAIVQRNARRLLDLVNQLLDLSKLDAGKMDLHIKTGDLQSFINLLCVSFDSLAENRNIEFHKNITINNLNAWYDPDKIEKIINNVLFNAFKFTPAGGVVKLSVTENLNSELLIRISDSGVGIPANEQQHIFSPFYQSKHIADNGQPGTGLGLSLVSELVKLYRGKIELESKVEVGTTISITLPMHKMEWAILQENPPFDQINKKHEEVKAITIKHGTNFYDTDSSDSILIIEDNEELRNFIASKFINQFKVLTAEDGEEGLAQAIEHIPDLIVSDVMMPKMDGIELTDKLKSDERTNHIPIILLTAKADVQSKIEGFKKGADDYLAKPFSTDELKVRASNLIEQRKRLALHFKDKLSQSTPEPKELSLDEKFIAKAKACIESNISNQGLSVEFLAAEMNLSRAQLFRKFKALINTSPSEFINDVRLSRAAKMIRSKTDTLAQICYAVGFNEQSYFAKRFRKKYGVSPREYAET